MPLDNTLPWHIDYFELEALRETMGAGYSDLRFGS